MNKLPIKINREVIKQIKYYEEHGLHPLKRPDAQELIKLLGGNLDISEEGSIQHVGYYIHLLMLRKLS